MWPPSRSAARSASSRLTRSPARSGPSEVSASVWFITSASKPSRVAAVAVRQTPLTATESPSAISPAERGRDPQPRALGAGSTASTVPTSAISPVNTSPLPHPGPDQDVVADPLGLGGQRPGRIGDPLHSRPSSAARPPPSRIGATKRRISSISPAAAKAPASVGPPSRKQAGDLAPTEVGERGAKPARRSAPPATTTSAPARAAPPARAGSASARRRRAAGARRGVAHELRVERQPRRRVEDDPRRLAARRPSRGRSAAGRRRGRCRCRPRSRRPRRASGGRAARLCSPEIHFESPRRVATRPSREIAIFSVTSGRPVRACFRNGWLSSRAAAASSPAANSTSTPPSRSIPGPRPEAFSLGSSEAITTRAIPASRIASVQGGWRPLVGAGLERHVHRRPGRVLAAGAGSPRARPARRAGRRARRESPRRSPRRRGRSPRRPADSG